MDNGVEVFNYNEGGDFFKKKYNFLFLRLGTCDDINNNVNEDIAIENSI